MAKSPRPPSVAEAIALMQKARARGRGRRSPIMVWMQQNHEALATAFTQNAPAWSVLATYLGERGITDGDGKLPSARATREAWGRVKAIVAAKATSVEAVAGKTAPVSADGGDNAKVDVPATPRRFRPVKLRGVGDGAKHTTAAAPASATPSAHPPPNPEPGVDVDDLLSRFMPGATSRD
jgi:hypothetical protein